MERRSRLATLLLLVASLRAETDDGTADDGDGNIAACRDQCADIVGSSLIRITHCDRGCHIAAHVWQLSTHQDVPPRPFAAIKAECTLRCRSAEDDNSAGVDEDVVANCAAGCTVFTSLPTLCSAGTFIGADAARPSDCARCPLGSYHPLASETDDGMLADAPCRSCPAGWWLPLALRSELAARMDSAQHCSRCGPMPCAALVVGAFAALLSGFAILRGGDACIARKRKRGRAARSGGGGGGGGGARRGGGAESDGLRRRGGGSGAGGGVDGASESAPADTQV